VLDSAIKHGSMLFVADDPRIKFARIEDSYPCERIPQPASPKEIDNWPKTMIDIAGKPLLRHVMNVYSAYKLR
jgi:hypothetical protein